ncbi:MAG: 4Fe-4S cluster-binding domain-containing protein [Oscillospiraceae bacterium]|jgi:7-carboxy-7-deazaguanine synthase|nr:4Fe-4S cluster-binding domain-containing protein [Oscillospiraceae bacterium]
MSAKTEKKNLRLCQIFKSLSGEGLRSGYPATLVRFGGCNLSCRYCDTKYSWNYYHNTSVEEILGDERVRSAGFIIIAGGEPFYQCDEIFRLIGILAKSKIVEIETNGVNLFDNIKKLYGALDLSDYKKNIRICSDYKTEESDEYARGALDGFELLTEKDCIKVVVQDFGDVDLAEKLVVRFRRTNVLVSPCYGEIDPAKLADYMIDKNYLNLKMQIQLNKFLWGDGNFEK